MVAATWVEVSKQTTKPNHSIIFLYNLASNPCRWRSWRKRRGIGRRRKATIVLQTLAHTQCKHREQKERKSFHIFSFVREKRFITLTRILNGVIGWHNKIVAWLACCTQTSYHFSERNKADLVLAERKGERRVKKERDWTYFQPKICMHSNG